MSNHHHWIRAARRRDRDRLLETLDVPPVFAVLDAHRRLRGPYTAAGTLLRSIADDALARCPELGVRHRIEIATCAPELADRVPAVWTTLEWTVRDSERTRFYSRLHTLNIANGVADLLRAYLDALGRQPRTLVIENAHEADPTDQELVAVLLRRTDLGPLTIIVGTGTVALEDPRGEIAISMARNLAEHARTVDAPPASDDARVAGAGPDARGYVESDCTSDDPAAAAAYAELSADERAALHDDRATRLADANEISVRRGALPFHLEHGSDPEGAGAAALCEAMDGCRGIGLYQAAADLGLRGRALVDPSREKLWWHLTEATTMSLASLGRAEEAEAIYLEARGATKNPALHMEIAYGMAMLYTRHYSEERRDSDQARAWMNLAVAIASVHQDPKKRAFRSVFSENGLALVEVRQGNPVEALRLVEDGAARLDAELKPGEQELHRTVLRYNRAQVLGMMGRLEESLADFEAVADADPDFPEHHFNVGNVLRRLGRNADAIAAFERAIHRSPPFAEAYYNRGDTRWELGDVVGALADFEYVAQLDPQRVDAHLNRASLLRGLGRGDEALGAVAAALDHAPTHPHLLCLQAQLLSDAGDVPAAYQAVSAALDHNEGLAEAWALRGELAYADGDLDRAAADLDRALELADSPAVRFNRAVVHEESGLFAAAVADYEAVLVAQDDPDAQERLARCASLLAGEATLPTI